MCYFLQNSPESDAMHTPLADYPVVIEIPVAWGEMDAYGHVNNIVSSASITGKTARPCFRLS